MGDFNGGYGGGGFSEDAFNTTNQFDSPSAKPKKDRRIQRITPITAKMVKESVGESMTLNGAEVGIITIVGIIQDVKIANSKITYVINDGTGNIEAVKWADEGKTDGEEYRPLVENTYCRLVGTIKTTQDKHYIMIFTIRALDDVNRITTHMLETVYYDLKLKALESMSNGVTSAEGGFNKQGTSLGTGTQGRASFSNQPSNVPGLTTTQSLVFQVIQMASHSEAGCQRTEIYQAVRGKVPEREIGIAIEFLSGEGHIYSTIDDDTFRATDS